MKVSYLILRSIHSGTRSIRSGLRVAGSLRESISSLAMEVEDLDESQLARERRRSEHVAAVETIPLQLIRPVASSNEILDSDADSWGIAAIRVSESPFSGDGVKVAVLDSGIDERHPAFRGMLLTQKNFTDDSPEDEDGHGTHCAGTFFGRDMEGRRIGVARGIKHALIGKVLGRAGSSTASLMKAIQWAANEGANVISLSLGIDFPGYQAQLVSMGMPQKLATSRALRAYLNNVRLFDSVAEQLKQAENFGEPCLLVAASGNESCTDMNPDFKLVASPPAASEGVICVGAVGRAAQGFTRASFSNIGVSLVAPGVDIVSAKVGGSLIPLSGTSMAAPHVAGVIALLAEQLGRQGLISSNLLKTALMRHASSKRLAPHTHDEVGGGLVQAPTEA